MKKHLLLGVSLVALTAASPASAAPPTPFNWTGWYGGVNVGYSWGKAAVNYTDPAFSCCGTGLPTSFSGSANLDGIIGGFQTGYNWQVNNSWVFGIEADIQDSGQKGSKYFSNSYSGDCEGICTINQYQTVKLEWFGTVRGRFGVLVNPTLWLYGTGGLAYGNINVTGGVTDLGCSPACSWSYGSSTTKAGWTVGAGIEGLVPGIDNWTWKVEYLYIDFGTVSGSGFETDFGSTFTWSTRVTDNIFRFGFNHKLP
jgi:outer membrane immunogenic protein